MITAGAITRFADRDGVAALVVERDYVLTHVIDALARSGPPAGLVFKGGTALRLCYFADFRYSADLDFSVPAESLDEAMRTLGRAAETCRDENGFPVMDVDGDRSRIDYVGPLGRPRPVKLDIATDELVLDTTRRPLVSRYTDLGEVRVARRRVA